MYKLGMTIVLDVVTSASGGAAPDADAPPTVKAFEDITDVAIATYTMVKRTGETGVYRAEIALTTGAGYEVGKSYNFHAIGAVGGVTGKACIARFALDGTTIDELLKTTAYAAAPTVVQVRSEMDANSTRLANLDATISSRHASGAGVASVTAPVTVGANNDKTGYVLSTPAPTAAAVAAAVRDVDNTSPAVGSLGANVKSASTGGVDAQAVADAVAAAIGTVQIDLTQAVPTSNVANTIGDCMNAARAQGFGKWIKVGPNLTLFAPDGTTIVRTFTLDDALNPTTRS